MILQANVWKNETLNMAFLTRLFPSKATKYFFCLVSLVFNQQIIKKSHFPWVIRHKIHLFLQTFSETFAVFAPKQDGARNRGRVYSTANWETSRTSIWKRVLINQYQFFMCKAYHVESFGYRDGRQLGLRLIFFHFFLFSSDFIGKSDLIFSTPSRFVCLFLY